MNASKRFKIIGGLLLLAAVGFFLTTGVGLGWLSEVKTLEKAAKLYIVPRAEPIVVGGLVFGVCFGAAIGFLSVVPSMSRLEKQKYTKSLRFKSSWFTGFGCLMLLASSAFFYLAGVKAGLIGQLVKLEEAADYSLTILPHTIHLVTGGIILGLLIGGTMALLSAVPNIRDLENARNR